jgi:uncharacterized membrane protein
VPPLDLNEIYTDAFAEIALYGASDVQIGTRLQQALLTLGHIGGADTAGAIREQSALALERAKNELTLQRDTDKLEALARDVRAACDRH